MPREIAKRSRKTMTKEADRTVSEMILQNAVAPVGFVYLASPYSHKEANIRIARYIAARDFCIWAFQKRLPVFSPIAHWHPITSARPELPTDAESFMAQNDIMVASAGTLAVLAINGWDKSNGVYHELRLARNLRKLVVLVHPEPNDYSFETYS
jgi:hypothetical protein